jgi:hypothetical protein
VIQGSIHGESRSTCRWPTASNRSPPSPTPHSAHRLGLYVVIPRSFDRQSDCCIRRVSRSSCVNAVWSTAWHQRMQSTPTHRDTSVIRPDDPSASTLSVHRRTDRWTREMSKPERTIDQRTINMSRARLCSCAVCMDELISSWCSG